MLASEASSLQTMTLSQYRVPVQTAPLVVCVVRGDTRSPHSTNLASMTRGTRPVKLRNRISTQGG